MHPTVHLLLSYPSNHSTILFLHFFSIQPTIQLSFSIHPTIPLFLSNHLTSIFVFPSNHPIFLSILPYMFFYPSNHLSFKNSDPSNHPYFIPDPTNHPSFFFCPSSHPFFNIHPFIFFNHQTIHVFSLTIQPSIYCFLFIHLFCSIHTSNHPFFQFTQPSIFYLTIFFLIIQPSI